MGKSGESFVIGRAASLPLWAMFVAFLALLPLVAQAQGAPRLFPANGARPMTKDSPDLPMRLSRSAVFIDL